MSMLWLGIAGMGLLACLFVLWPMVVVGRQVNNEQQLRKQANITLYQQQQQELERQFEAGEIEAEQLEPLKTEAAAELLEVSAANEAHQRPQRTGGVMVLGGACFALLVAVLWFYQFNGASDDLQITTQLQQKLKADAEALSSGKSVDPEFAKQLMARLELKLESEPGNQQYLYLKANTAIELQQFEKALAAYKALIQAEESPLVMAELAQLLHYLLKGKFTPEIELLLDKSLKKDPSNILALELLGLKSFQAKDYRAAIQAWGKIFLAVGPQSAKGRSIAAGIQRARQLLEQNPDAVAKQGVAAEQGTGSEQQAEQGAKPEITVEVSLAEGLALPPEHVVFIYARQWQGAPIPLAIARHTVDDLPIKVVLNDSMAMAPQFKMSNFEQLELIARVSASGSVKPAKGDYQVTLGPVKMSDKQSVYPLLISAPL